MVTKHGKKAAAIVFAVLLCFTLAASQGMAVQASSGMVHGSENSSGEVSEGRGQATAPVNTPKNITDLQYGDYEDFYVKSDVQYGDHYQDYDDYQDLYIMTDVSSHVYTLGSGENVTIQCSGKLKDFTGVQVDGVRVDAGNYYLEEGSTILTFVAKYLDTLTVGKHSVTMNYTYDSINTELTILGRADIPADNPGGITDGIQDVTGNVSNTVSGVYGSGNPAAVKTGDGTPVVFWLVAMAAALGSCVVLGARKRTV